MREKLQERRGQRGTFTATFKRFGLRSAYKGPSLKTALFVDVTDAAGNAVADHLWFTVRLRLERLDLQPGDVIRFKATPEAYSKGYRGRRDDDDYSSWDLPAPGIDYCLKRPSDVSKTNIRKPVGHSPETVLNVPDAKAVELEEEVSVQDLDLDAISQGRLF